MPPARRRSSAKKDEANTEVVDETTEDEATEGEEEAEAKPKRTPKLYSVKDAELANELVGDDFESEINEGDEASGEMIDSMRREGRRHHRGWPCLRQGRQLDLGVRRAAERSQGEERQRR
jgi:hypothetical protein